MSKKLSTEPYKGVRDFYPEDQAFLNHLFAICRRAAESWGYVEYGASVLEPAELYKAKGSENEEIVNEQTYTFIDRGEREVTLRPEMTPTVARMVSARRREWGYPLRLFSIPNLFRYERPQRGRLREHWQLNVDLFGAHSRAAEAEIIALAHTLLLKLGAQESDFLIKINSRAHLNQLMDEFKLSEGDRGSFLYLLDRRAKMPREEFEAELAKYPIPLERLSAETVPEDVAEVMRHLADAHITNVAFDLGVVRGFSYYTGVIFEVFDTHSQNNRSLFGGGRYDKLTALFDTEPVTGVGFGMGDVTIRDFLAVRDRIPPYQSPTQLYIALTSPALVPQARALQMELQQGGVAVALDFGEKKLGDQIKAATKHRIPYLLVVGEDEAASQSFALKRLRDGSETMLRRDELASYLRTTHE